MARVRKNADFLVFLGSLLLLLFISVFILTCNVIDNQRFILFVQTMFRTGITFFPMIDVGSPYPDYLSLGTIFSYLVSLPFGHVSIFSMVFPYCLAGALSALLIYRIGALHNKKFGIYAVFFLFASWKFTDGVSSMALDTYLLFICVFCFYLLYANHIKNRKHSFFTFFLIVVGLIFGFFIRGPMGVFVPTVVISGLLFVLKDWKRAMIVCFLSEGVFIMGSMLVLYKAYQIGGHIFLMKVISFEVLGRFNGQHAARPYFYFSNGLSNYLITVFFALGVVFVKRIAIMGDSQRSITVLLRSALVWFGSLIFFFSIPHDKEARYVMSILAPISLLASYMFQESTKMEKLKKLLIFTGYLAIIAGIILTVTEWIYWRLVHQAVNVNFHFSLYFCIVAGILFSQYIIKKRASPYFYFSLLAFITIFLTVMNGLVLSPLGLYNDFPDESYLIIPYL